jgi:predicted nucleotidyltransferase
MTTEAAAAREKLLRQELARLIDIVAQQMQPERIILFGSLAVGQVDEWSDLDLVVIAETDLSFYERMKQVLRSVRPQAGMDVLIYTPAEWAEMISQRRFVQEEILSKGQEDAERWLAFAREDLRMAELAAEKATTARSHSQSVTLEKE